MSTIVVTALLSTACVSAERAAEQAPAHAAAGEHWVSLERSTAEGVFAEKCGMCHRANGMGTFILGRRLAADDVWLENRSDLQTDFVRQVVRNGFGLMFPMSRGEVSDDQLETIAAYLAEGE
ncbi:MAG: cytochrome c [Pseudomonadales bacterium]|nr:cytochrome c [Pseudomonadales bacterium]